MLAGRAVAPQALKRLGSSATDLPRLNRYPGQNVERLAEAPRVPSTRHQVHRPQAEFSLTQVFDRPLSGRIFFEHVHRENLGLGRPDQVQLIFDRRILRSTNARFRTRVITNGVVPSLHVDFKNSRIKHYHKEGRALRG